MLGSDEEERFSPWSSLAGACGPSGVLLEGHALVGRLPQASAVGSTSRPRSIAPSCGCRPYEARKESAARPVLTDFLAEPGDRIRYAYDFGDFLEHDIVLEKMLEPDPGVRLPACVAGKGACPPEDCGGVWGYADLRDTLANPASEEHDAMLEWLGLDGADDFDPAAFALTRPNEILGMATASPT